MADIEKQMKLTPCEYYRHTMSALLKLQEESCGRMGAIGKANCEQRNDIEKRKIYMSREYITSRIFGIFGDLGKFRHQAAGIPAWWHSSKRRQATPYIPPVLTTARRKCSPDFVHSSLWSTPMILEI